jgi:hypothetical protein
MEKKWAMVYSIAIDPDADLLGSLVGECEVLTGNLMML